MKENKILISVLVPTYNRRKYLEECLNSIIEQRGFTKDEIEVIIGDNSESDETKKFMDKFLKLNHQYNIRYIKNEMNMGSTRNVNNLLGESCGEYFIILSDDDKFYDENSLRALYEGILGEDDICLCRGIIVYPNVSNKIDAASIFMKNEDSFILTFKENMIKNLLNFGGILYRKEDVHYGEKFGGSGDYHFNWRYLHDFGNGKIINRKCFVYRDRKTFVKDRYLLHFKQSKRHRRILNDFSDISIITKIFLRGRYHIILLFNAMFGEKFGQMANFVKKIYKSFC